MEVEYTKIIEELKKSVEELEERLKAYTSTHRQKKYYEKNKEQIIEKTKEYNKNHKRVIDPEKIKEYNFYIIFI